MARSPVAWVTAIVLFAEAVGVALVNWFLGIVVDRQDMSLAGLDPGVMSVSSKVAGLLFGLYLALCGAVALRVALRDRAPVGLGRILLISGAVVHGLLGAITVGLVGWGAFAFMMVVLGLIVLIFMTYDRQEAAVSDAKPDGGPSGNGGPSGDGSRNGDGSGKGSGNGGAPVRPPPPAPSTP